MDLGLPSGTLWLDRLVGAQSPSENGLFYQWGAIIGYRIDEGYDFSYANYKALGLDLITSNLAIANDAARAYYGPIARMPDYSRYQELIDNCDITFREDGLLNITSRINGNTITIPPCGIIIGPEHRNTSQLRAWSRAYYDSKYANCLHVGENNISLGQTHREYGCCVMAVRA